jgi:hypothetical protein
VLLFLACRRIAFGFCRNFPLREVMSVGKRVAANGSGCKESGGMKGTNFNVISEQTES